MSRISFLIVALLAPLLSPVVSAQSRVTGDPVPAIWRTHRVDFAFRSEAVAFRCEEFAWRLERILGSVGARLDSRTQLECADAFSHTIKGNVVFTAPVEATQENVQRVLADISSVEQLAARVNRLPDPRTRIRVFPAEWQPSATKPKLDAADCSLLRALSRQVLPVIELRELDISTTCAGNRAPRFSAIALIRVEGASIDQQRVRPPAVAETHCTDARPDDACDSPETETDLETMPAG